MLNQENNMNEVKSIGSVRMIQMIVLTGLYVLASKLGFGFQY